MNRQKIAMTIAVCLIVSTGIVPVNVNATTEPVNIESTLSKSLNLSSKTPEDIVLPTLSSVRIASSSNSSIAIVGDIITLKFTSSEVLKKNPTITILGSIIKDSDIVAIGNDYTATYTLNSTNLEGIVTFNISNVVDMELNQMTTDVSDTTTGDVINFSNQVLSEVTMQSDNKNKMYANPGNTITLKFTSFRTLVKTPQVKINGVYLDVSVLTPNTYTATYALRDARIEGPITFSIDDLEDVSGLKSTKSITDVTTGSGVTFYNSTPTVSNVWLDSNESNKSVKPGSTIYLNFTTNRQLSDVATEAPIIKIFNQLITPEFVTYKDSTYTVAYVLKDTDPEGYVAFEISKLTDLAGNVNSKIINSVPIDKNIKYDKTPPIISNVTFTSNNPISNLAKPNDKVTLEFDTDGTEFMTTNVIIAGHKVSAVKDPITNHYKAEYTLDDTTEAGLLPYAFNGILDEAGNVGVPSVVSTDSVLYDKTSTTLSDISLKAHNSSGVSTTYASVSDIVDLTFTSSEKLEDNQFVTINGQNCKVTSSSGNIYTASYVLTNNDIDGNVVFKISSLLDISGNKSILYTSTTDDSFVTLDKTAPTISIGGVMDNEYNNHVSTDALITFYDNNFDLNSNLVTINGEDVTSSLEKTGDGLYSYNFHATKEGKYIIKAYGKDLSQNATTKTLTFNIDRTLPVLNFNQTTPYMNRIFTPTITKGDPEDDIFEVSINGVSVDPNNLPTLSKNQKYTIKARSIDKAGNISKVTVSTFILDTIRPKINVSGLIQSFFYATDVNPNITFMDVNLLNSTMTLNGAAYNNSKISKDGVYNLLITSTDKANNISEQIIHFVIDKSSPILEFKFPLNNMTFNTMIKPILITQSKYGLDSITMFLDGEIYHGEDITIEGKHSIIVTAKNKSGITTKKTFTFFIKTTPPVIRITNVVEDKTYESGIIPQIYQEEAIKYDMTLNNKPYVFGQAINSTGPYTLVIRATDTADNLATKTIHFTVENKTLVSSIKALNPVKALKNPQSSLPFIAGVLVLCLAGILGFLKFKPKKKDAAN